MSNIGMSSTIRSLYRIDPLQENCPIPLFARVVIYVLSMDLERKHFPLNHDII